MHRTKAGAGLAAAIIGIMLLTGCSGQQTAVDAVQQVEGLEHFGKIRVITREEGSGTRGVFAEKLGLVNESSKSGSDRITEQAQVAMNAEAVIEAVKQDRAGIGFVSLGALGKAADGIKTVKISGTEASAKTIADGSYPLGRNFNLAYCGELSAAGIDFLKFILSAGQDITAQNYVSIGKASAFLSDQSAGTIEIAGSTSVEPLMQQLSEAYQAVNKHVEITIRTSDSTAGLTAAMQKSCDFGMASRDLKDYEKELLTWKTIARDGVTVIVNQDNPVESLTSGQLAAIFSGEDTVWIDINK